MGLTYQLNTTKDHFLPIHIPRHFIGQRKSMKLSISTAFAIALIFIFRQTSGRYLLVQVDDSKGIFIYEIITLLIQLLIVYSLFKRKHMSTISSNVILINLRQHKAPWLCSPSTYSSTHFTTIPTPWQPTIRILSTKQIQRR